MASADPYTLIFSRPSPLRGVYDSNNNFITCKDASVTLKDRLNLDTKTGGKTGIIMCSRYLAADRTRTCYSGNW